MEILECVIRKKKQKQKQNKSICLDPETFGLLDLHNSSDDSQVL